MTLRITQSMFYGRALQDLRKNSLGLIELQEQIASGRRVNRPSDDPSSMLRILPLRSELNDLVSLKDNVAQARETLNSSTSAMEQASSLLQRLQELVVQGANGTNSITDLRSLGVEVNELLGQMVGIGNVQRSGIYLFGGTKTTAAPFQIVENNGGTRVLYNGDRESHEIDVAPGTRSEIYSSGADIFQTRSRKPTLFNGSTGAAPSGSQDTGIGYGRLDVAFAQLQSSSLPTGITGSGSTPQSNAVGPLDYTFSAGQLSIAGGPAVTLPVTDFEFQTGDSPARTIHLTVGPTVTPANGQIIAEATLSTDGGATTQLVDFSSNEVAVANSFDDTILNVDVSTLAQTGQEEVTFQGTFDVFTVLIAVRDVLVNEEDLSADEVGARLRQLLPEIRGSHDGILENIQKVGFRSQSLDLLKDRVETLDINRKESLSVVQDADLSESITELVQKQSGFEAALQVSARIVQTSLLNFLR